MVELSTLLRLARALEQEDVAYILVGGLALFAQGLPGVTNERKPKTYKGYR
ncbi:MAG: hypothetical protein HYU64_20715 [Armatimonadetes bacterium]|nr:hypothetical protein [Armatimonadota bacterium]